MKEQILGVCKILKLLIFKDNSKKLKQTQDMR